jgi:copper chaperone CopZ
MKKTFTLENLDCANCAAKLERKLQKMDGVDSATVTFMTKKLEIEADDALMDNIVAEATGIITKLEPQVVVKERR